jgi:DNA polymerase III epsilon subunit family exonuclease
MPFSLIHSLQSIPVACVDVETTGASAELGDRVIEVGIARYENGAKVGEYQQLIDPRHRISGGVSALTGITQAMCDGQPTFAEQFPAMCEFLRGAAVLGHNVNFDLGFLQREFRRSGHDLSEALENAPVFDTVRIARRRFGRGGNSLGKLARRLGYEPSIAHRALADAVTTGWIFDRMLEPVGGWAICLCDVLREQGGPMKLAPETAQDLLPLELEEALENRQPVMMEYLDAAEQRTQRVVNPLQVKRVAGELVLIAHCQLRNDRRHFKLERIVRLDRIEAPTPEVVAMLPTIEVAPPADREEVGGLFDQNRNGPNIVESPLTPALSPKYEGEVGRP